MPTTTTKLSKNETSRPQCHAPTRGHPHRGRPVTCPGLRSHGQRFDPDAMSADTNNRAGPQPTTDEPMTEPDHISPRISPPGDATRNTDTRRNLRWFGRDPGITSHSAAASRTESLELSPQGTPVPGKAHRPPNSRKISRTAPGRQATVPFPALEAVSRPLERVFDPRSDPDRRVSSPPMPPL
jgi:hypothetical protein